MVGRLTGSARPAQSGPEATKGSNGPKGATGSKGSAGSKGAAMPKRTGSKRSGTSKRVGASKGQVVSKRSTSKATSATNGLNGATASPVEQQTGDQPTAKLGTFGGVFTPSLLTILGLILFLRLGFATGNVGLFQMLAILALASGVSLITTVSLAAIATNLRVGGGGVYFLISRTLGPAFGGAVGLVLYVAMSVSVAFYAIGLGEAVSSVLGSTSAATPRLIAAGTIVLLVGLAWLGADIATRFQYLVMACLTVAIIAFVIGVVPELSVDQLGNNLGHPSGGLSFWATFAIFFPAITGFTQGVAMSGDLKSPSRSITTGTFGAIGVSTVVYLFVIVAFAMAVPLAELRADTSIMRTLSLHPALVDVGVIAATLSSAIASILGAPRILQRLAADRLMPPLKPFAHGSGAHDNPRRAVLLSAGIALFTVAVADLDLMAPVISMFFLASYGLINYATYSEARAASTSFRPTFRLFDWRLSLLGTVACVVVIIAIDPVAGTVASLAVFGLHQHLQRTVQQAGWTDSTRAFHASGMRSHLRQMGAPTRVERDWRPVTVVFAPRDYERRTRLTEVASWIEGGAGFTTVARIIPGGGAVARKHAAKVELELQRELAYRNHDVYGRVIVASDLPSGTAAMLQAHGIGPLRTNLSLFSWFGPVADDDSAPDDHHAMLRTAARFGANVGLVHAPVDEADPGDNGGRRSIRGSLAGGAAGARRTNAAENKRAPIVVWWRDDTSGQLLTLLAWMCTRSEAHAGADVEVLVEAGADVPEAQVTALLADARLPATVVGTASVDDFADRVSGARMVFAPLRVSREAILGPGDRPLNEAVDRLPVTVFAQAAADVQLDAQPDDANMTMLAEATERATEATARANEFDAEASQLLVKAEMLAMEFGHRVDHPRVVEAHQKARAAHRRYLDARSRADEAWRLVSEIDPMSSTDRVDPKHWIEAPKPAKR